MVLIKLIICNKIFEINKLDIWVWISIPFKRNVEDWMYLS